MTEIMVRCRTCGAMLPTGVDMAQELFKVADVEGHPLTCTQCNETRTWTKADAYFLG